MSDGLLNQQDIELQMYHGGIARATSLMQRAEEKGRADTNPYSQELYRRFVQPVAHVIREDTATGKAGRQLAHAALLGPLPAESVALLSVRCAINGLLQGDEAGTVRRLAGSLGTTIHRELVLTQIEQQMPELYATLVRDLGRRQSKSEQHRVSAMRASARNAGLTWTEWPVHAVHQVGMYLVGVLEKVGLIEIAAAVADKRVPRAVSLSADVLDQITRVKSFVAISMPTYGPCVEPPLDWTTFFDGGYHTRELRRAHSCLVRAASMGSIRHLYRDREAPVVLAAVNALQRTRWKVNRRILDTLYALHDAGVQNVTKEVVTNHVEPKPPVPAGLDGLSKEQMTTEQLGKFLEWKRQMSEWYTQRRLQGTRAGRFYSATRAAFMFKDYPELYFVYFADNRGRFYPMTYGLNPQGSDLQKSLLHFVRGCSVRDKTAERWFLIHGANKWGFDKASLDARARWHEGVQDQLMAIALDPVGNTSWRDADKPLQFLAWCFEYADWLTDPVNFRSHIPISMDGSCNGLQNLSALLRDEIGGRATNLVPQEEMADVYREVAEATLRRLHAMPLDAEGIVARWRTAGIERSMVKRAVMTMPYGVTFRTAWSYVIEETLRAGKVPAFGPKEYRAAADVFMKAMWPAIGEVVVKGREAMDWLKASARAILKARPAGEEPIITWDTPSGFPASQAYFEAELLSVRTHLNGESRIRVAQETEDPDSSKHAAGLAPNFVHSMDAAHLHRVAAAAASRAIDDLAMIHDDYGTHADRAQELYEIIREEFVSMYEEHDPIEELAKKYPVVPSVPAKGSLDIRGVLDSPYFFS